MKSPPTSFSLLREKSFPFFLEFSLEPFVSYEALSIVFGDLSMSFLCLFSPNIPASAPRTTFSDRRSLIKFGVQILGLSSHRCLPSPPTCFTTVTLGLFALHRRPTCPGVSPTRLSVSSTIHPVVFRCCFFVGLLSKVLLMVLLFFEM